VSNKSPLRSPEERMTLDIGGSGSCSETSVLVLDEEFADQRFTKTESH
jgi:hypothetical protein